MTEQEATKYPRPVCSTDGCIGMPRDGQEACLAHVSAETRKAILAGLTPGADLDLTGTPIDLELLSQLLAALRPEDGPPVLGHAFFPRARFTEDASFKDVHFTGYTMFAGAQFSGDAEFAEAQFSEGATFGAAHFSGAANFAGTHFAVADFMSAQFQGVAEFGRAQFSGALFQDAQFAKAASFTEAQVTTMLADFSRAQFSGVAWFRKAQFKTAVFTRAQFREDAKFYGTRFTERAEFAGAQFGGDAHFFEVQFSGDAQFGKDPMTEDPKLGGAQFSGVTSFSRAQFGGFANFAGVRFSGDADFAWVQFSGDAEFDGVQFEAAATFRPVSASSILSLNRATFEQDTTMEVVGAQLSCVATRFADVATLRLRRAEVVLDSAVFAKPSTVAFAPDPFRLYIYTSFSDKEKELLFGEDPAARIETSRHPRPRLLSLRGVDVGTLTLSDLDLGACLFQGAYHLDQLRIEGARPFADTPAVWRLYLGRWWVPVWRRWSRRQTLAEEHHWRSDQPSPPGPGRWSWLTQPDWHGPACQTPEWVVRVQTGQWVQRLTPDRLAVLYRALRKAQEDSKNEPGAADFYYGEMEMRRQDRNSPLAERVVVWLYWLVSGYGLRGLRALATLLAMVLLAAVVFAFWGFAPAQQPPRPVRVDPQGMLVYEQPPAERPAGLDELWAAARFSAQSATALLRGPDRPLTPPGEWLHMGLRLVGPVLLGLAVLALRGRVKR